MVLFIHKYTYLMVVVYRNRLVSFYASNSLRFFTSISMSMTKYTKFILEESHSLSPSFAGGLEMTSKINHLQNPDYYLESYLAGLIEGDGHFNTPKAFIPPSLRRSALASKPLGGEGGG